MENLLMLLYHTVKFSKLYSELGCYVIHDTIYDHDNIFQSSFKIELGYHDIDTRGPKIRKDTKLFFFHELVKK